MKSKLTFLFSFFLLLLLPTALIFAATTPAFKPLVGIPGLTDASPNFNTYINTLYSLSISIAALLAVIKIIIAGMKYMLSDVVTTKGDAIKDIRGALLGLLIVVSAVLILRVINPQLTETTIFFDPVTNQTSSFTGSTSGTNGSGGPLPTNINASSVIPGMVENVTCANATCSAEYQTCKDSGGKVSIKTIRVGNTFQCEHGEVVSKPTCDYDTNPVDGHYENINCSSTAAKCPAGSTYIPPESGQVTAKCYKPYPVPSNTSG